MLDKDQTAKIIGFAEAHSELEDSDSHKDTKPLRK